MLYLCYIYILLEEFYSPSMMMANNLAPGMPMVTVASQLSTDDDKNLKRRKRCGECVPCMVQKNCEQCKNCLNRKILKQTCIYRKCVYLRKKDLPDSAGAPPQSSFGANLSGPHNANNAFGAAAKKSMSSHHNAAGTDLLHGTVPRTQPVGTLANGSSVLLPPTPPYPSMGVVVMNNSFPYNFLFNDVHPSELHQNMRFFSPPVSVQPPVPPASILGAMRRSAPSGVASADDQPPPVRRPRLDVDGLANASVGEYVQQQRAVAAAQTPLRQRFRPSDAFMGSEDTASVADHVKTYWPQLISNIGPDCSNEGELLLNDGETAVPCSELMATLIPADLADLPTPSSGQRSVPPFCSGNVTLDSAGSNECVSPPLQNSYGSGLDGQGDGSDLDGIWPADLPPFDYDAVAGALRRTTTLSADAAASYTLNGNTSTGANGNCFNNNNSNLCYGDSVAATTGTCSSADGSTSGPGSEPQQKSRRMAGSGGAFSVPTMAESGSGLATPRQAEQPPSASF